MSSDDVEALMSGSTCRCGAKFIRVSNSYDEVFLNNSVVLLCELGHRSMVFRPVTVTSEILNVKQWVDRLVEKRCACPECGHLNLKRVHTEPGEPGLDWIRGAIFLCKRKHLCVFPDENRYQHDLRVEPLALHILQNHAVDPDPDPRSSLWLQVYMTATERFPSRSHTWRMLDVFMALMERGPMCISGLAAALGYSTQTITRAVTDLHHRDLISYTLHTPSQGGHKVRVWEPILKQKL